ncbi:ABC transporter ATP-binding protein [Aquisphaera giovannonii]|uniref:ABC transporter ATP-binding protein n=1 Tax=Aquisphaera giovannonii TaxID=406548 RepID=UPI0011E069E4|nr:ATP-binding cassette domain-containing protein [Aquisphaera giovannonii]
MIAVEQLTKLYGSVRAIESISFGIGRGEVVGLLGPNGAGKTTTMRILTTYLAPTSGRATLAGHDVLDEPLEVRKHVGYLPESVPLYGEMRVREYLGYRARLKDVPRPRRRAAIGDAVARCRLGDVEDRIIGHLSRGYRQRVGLAEALLHDPDVLILDEPTSGLDPIQIREVRDLIRELGERHTVLLSTHIMSEVEAVCSRVIIIAGGRIAVDDRLEHLRQGQAILVEARGPSDRIRAAIQSVEGVRRVRVSRVEGEVAGLEVQGMDGADVREAVARRVAEGGWPLRALELRRSSLEERFVEAVTRDGIGPEDAEALR